MERIKESGIRCLRWLEKYTKTDMVYLAKGGFWITLKQIIPSLISFFLVIVFANLLPKETYGIYKYILSLAGILNILTLTGMNNAVSRAVAVGYEGALKTSLKYQLKWNIMMLGAFWLLGIYYLINGNSLFAISFLILGIFVPATFALNTYGAYLDGKREFKLASISSIVSTIIYASGMLITIILSGEVVWLVVTYAITSFLSTIFFYYIVIHKFNPPETDTSDTINYGRKLTFIGFIGPISSQIDKIIIAHFWGPAQLAIYSLAMAIPDRTISLIKNWVGLGFPKFASKTEKEINTVFYRRIFQGMIIGLGISIIYIILSPYLFKYLLPQYIDSIFYSQILSISFVFAMPNRYISLLLVSQKMSAKIFTNSLIQNITKITLYLLLGLLGGIIGLIIANVLNSFVGMMVNILIWKKNIPIQNRLERYF